MPPHMMQQQYGQPMPFNQTGQPNMAQSHGGQQHGGHKQYSKKFDKKDKSNKVDKKFVQKQSPSKAPVEAK